MKIGIIGSRNIRTTTAFLLAQAGHQVYPIFVYVYRALTCYKNRVKFQLWIPKLELSSLF